MGFAGWNPIAKSGIVTVLVVAVLSVAVRPSPVAAQVTIEPDVVYGHKDGLALTYDVLRPASEATGAGVVYMVSGGWVSRWSPPAEVAERPMVAELLDRGFAVFVVRHGSSPRYKVPDALADTRAAVEHIRRTARDHGVSPERLGIMGYSAGGHLSLSIALRGEGAGDTSGGARSVPDAPPPGDRGAGPHRVAAVVAYFPPVDLRGWAGPNERFPALDFEPAAAEDLSPILYATADDPPTLLLHGDEDALVPLSHSARMDAALEDVGSESELVVFPGAGHGFEGADARRGIELTVSFFERHLARPPPPDDLIGVPDLLAFEAPEPDARIHYGDDPLAFGNLRLPTGQGPHPTVAFVHGGCFLSAYDIAHAAPAEEALAEAGYAVWSLEYRRVGDQGGGWPNTFLDIARGVDHLRTLERRYDLDLSRLVMAGHSAGANLALWAAARRLLPSGSELHSPDPLPIHGVLALTPAANVADLQAAGVCGGVIDGLMGGSATDFPDRYAQTSPMRLMPIDVPQRVVIGAHDRVWAPSGWAYARATRDAGAVDVTVVEAPESGHFDVIAPGTSTWRLVLDQLRSLIDPDRSPNRSGSVPRAPAPE